MEYPVTQLPVMDVAEIDDIPFDFSRGMLFSDVIAAIVFEVDVELGTDEAPGTMIVGGPLLGRLDPATNEFINDAQGRVVLQRFSAVGRPRRNTYCLRCKVTLASGRQLVAAGHVKVRKL